MGAHTSHVERERRPLRAVCLNHKKKNNVQLNVVFICLSAKATTTFLVKKSFRRCFSKKKKMENLYFVRNFSSSCIYFLLMGVGKDILLIVYTYTYF